MRRTIPIEHRFWSKVDQRGPDECWPWTGACGARGYGHIGRGRAGDGFIYAHRLAWELTHGPVLAGTEVCHHCDNPGCVNVRHLFLGSRLDNAHDAIGKRRHAHGETHYNAKLTTQDVIAIRNSPQSAITLAQRYGVSRQHISYVRNGKRRGYEPFKVECPD